MIPLAGMLIAAGAVTATGVGIYVARKRKSAELFGSKVAPGTKAIAAKASGVVIRATSVSQEGQQNTGGYGTTFEPISQATGWRPVWIDAAQNKWLEWGACYNRWQQDIQAHEAALTESKADDFMAKRLAKFWGYIFEQVPVIDFIVSRICFRVYLPATKLKIDGVWYFVPQSPSMPGFEKQESIGNGRWWIPGWKPGTSRFGFVTKWPKWPLGWPPPSGVVTGAWIRNLGDITRTGYDTYQLISVQNGSERSFPMMSEKGWRATLGFSDYVFGGHENGDPISMFHEWRGADQEGVQKKAASKTRATNRYQTPAD